MLVQIPYTWGYVDSIENPKGYRKSGWSSKYMGKPKSYKWGYGESFSFFYFVSSLPAQAARNKLFGNTKRSSQFLYEFVSWIGIKKFHWQKYLSPKKIDSPLCPGMWEHVQLCTKKFYPPSAKVDYTIWLEWHIVNPFRGVPKLQKTIPQNGELPATICRSVA